MTASVMVDTNILIYAYDERETEKRSLAAQILDRVQELDIGGLSVQNLSEFFTVAVRKYRPPMPVGDAITRVEKFTQSWEVFELTPAIVLAAMRAVQSYQLHYWDALLWATAQQHRVNVIISEDFQHDQVIDGVRFINPFRADFSIEMLDALVR